MKFTWMFHTYFAIMRLFFSKSKSSANTLLPTLCKTLYTSSVKFPASTSEHSSKSFFQPPVICKMASTYCILYRAKQGVAGGCHIWAVSRMRKNSPSHFCYCLTCSQAGVRLGIVVKEKDVCRVPVRKNSPMCCLRMSEVSLCRSWGL
jgi:hypothetical protein